LPLSVYSLQRRWPAITGAKRPLPDQLAGPLPCLLW